MALIILTADQHSLPLALDSTLASVQAGFKQLGLASTFTQIGQSAHLRSIKNGFELQFKNGAIQTIFAYFRTPKFSSFEGYIKYGINSGWTIKGAVCFLGEPPTKNKRIVEIIYPHLGLAITFQGTWQNEQSKIDYCYLFKPDNQQVCAGCGKQASKIFFVCACKVVLYCTKQCYKKHYGHHTIFCDQVQPL